jgi:multisubunit Na+/H+ antiporter MnhF subunit
MMKNLTLNRILWMLIGALSLTVAVFGVIDPAIYEGVVSPTIMPGVFTQDILVIITAVLLLILTAITGRSALRKQIVILGILGFLLYAYGIYAIEQLYNGLYPVYLAIVALSFYSLVYALACIPGSTATELRLPPFLRYVTAGFAILIAVMFNVIWIAQLIPLLRAGDRIEHTFSVYIIDLCFIMPAFVICAVMAMRKRILGFVGLPGLFILGVGILSPLALAEVLKPVLFDTARDPGGFWLYLILSGLFLILAVVYLYNLSLKR